MSLTGVAINHDGRAATITAPNGTAQQRVLRSALSERQTQGEDARPRSREVEDRKWGVRQVTPQMP